MSFIGIDTSSKGIAVFVKNSNNGEILISRHSKNPTGEDIVIILDMALKSLNIKVKDVKKAAIVTGPGSFTGLRVGMAFLKAFYLRNKIEIKGVNTLYAIAWQHRRFFEYILSFRIARTGLFYCGFFKNCEDGLTPIFMTESLSMDSVKEKIKTKEFVVAGDKNKEISSFLNNYGFITYPVFNGHHIASTLFELWNNPYSKILDANFMVPDYINPSPAGI